LATLFYLPASIAQTPLPIVKEKYGPGSPSSKSFDHASCSEEDNNVDDLNMDVAPQEDVVPLGGVHNVF
jgi:hypothetical protein